MNRLYTKITIIFTMILSSFLISKMINHYQLSDTVPITVTNTNVFIKDVDKSFLKRYKKEYKEGYVYYLTGTVTVKTYRGSNIFNVKTVNDTSNTLYLNVIPK